MIAIQSMQLQFAWGRVVCLNNGRTLRQIQGNLIEGRSGPNFSFSEELQNDFVCSDFKKGRVYIT